MILNGVMIVTSVSVIVYSIIYFIIDYQYFYGPLYIIPVGVTVLLLNHYQKHKAARTFYFLASLPVTVYWCYEGRGNGNEYILIGLASTSILLFQHRVTLYLICSLCAGFFILFKVYDVMVPFVPDPAINYDILPWMILLNTIAVVCFQMAFFRDLVYRYDSKLSGKYSELNFVLAQQKKTEEELRKLTQQLESLVKRKDTELQSYIDAINVNIYSCITDLEGLFVMVNTPLIQASGYSREQLIGQHYTLLATEQHQDLHYQTRRERLFDGKTWRGEVEHMSKDGKLYWFDCVVIPIKDEQDQIKCFLSLGLPATERKLNELMREKTRGLLETIAFATSHEIRGPLARIEGLTNLIQRNLISQEEYSSIAEMIAVCADELKMATNELVNFVNDHRESMEDGKSI
jgi:PAS domain S-box-containing protein